MRDNGAVRSLLQTLVTAVLGVGLGLAVLGAGFFISRMTLADNTVVVSTSTASPTRSPSPTPRPTVTPAPTTAPTVAPTPRPSPTPDPLLVTASSGQGLRLAALTIPAGYTLTSPIAGRVTIAVYQYIGGEIRTGANAADQPSFPYLFVTSADREIKLRPGALNRDIELLVKDGDTIAAGAALFKTLTTGASSWATFYDRNVTAQVIASVTALPSGVEIDPVPVFKR